MTTETQQTTIAGLAAQALFEQYRAEAEKSHAGEDFQKFVRALLMRATECGAFKP